MKAPAKYRIHRTLAIIVVPLLIISTLTGFFKANQKWYWEDGYKKKKHASSFSINGELIPVSFVTQKIDSVSHKKNKFDEINLKSENENLYYSISVSTKEKYLVDAYTAEMVSPISNKLASNIAAQYVKDKPDIKSCELLKDYVPRKGKDIKPVYKVEFNNEANSRIFLDYNTGEIIEDIDDNRQFGLWVMRLHEYDFFNSKRSLTSIVGIIIFLLALSGLWIYRARLYKLRGGVNTKSYNV